MLLAARDVNMNLVVRTPKVMLIMKQENAYQYYDPQYTRSIKLFVGEFIEKMDTNEYYFCLRDFLTLYTNRNPKTAKHFQHKMKMRIKSQVRTDVALALNIEKNAIKKIAKTMNGNPTNVEYAVFGYRLTDKAATKLKDISKKAIARATVKDNYKMLQDETLHQYQERCMPTFLSQQIEKCFERRVKERLEQNITERKTELNKPQCFVSLSLKMK